MVVFGSGASGAASAATAAEEALAQARASFRDTPPKLAVVFGSAAYGDLERAPDVVRRALGPDIAVVGGSAGGAVFAREGLERRGVSVVLVGGSGIEVTVASAALGSRELVDIVPAAARVGAAADQAARKGLHHATCLVLAPSIYVDGEALVAAVRKGAGARAQLVGGLAGDELTFDRPRVFDGDVLARDRAVIAGLFTRRPVGIGARHGWRAVGKAHTVTRAEGPLLRELDGRRAIDVWLEDVRRLGGVPPVKDLVAFLAMHWELGIIDPRGAEALARAPWEVTSDGIRLSGSIGEGRTVRVLHASRKDLLRASMEAATDAAMRAGGNVAGALVLPCTGRLAALGDEFPRELSAIRERVAAPIGGACVYGEIAKNGSASDAFFNTTTVVAAFAA